MARAEISAVVEKALKAYRKNKRFEEGLSVIGAGAREGAIELCEYDEACQEFRRQLEELVASGDDQLPVEWEELSKQGLLEQIGLDPEGGLKADPAGAGAIVPLAEASAD